MLPLPFPLALLSQAFLSFLPSSFSSLLSALRSLFLYSHFTEAEGICIVMLVAFSLAYMEERRQRAEAKKAEEV